MNTCLASVARRGVQKENDKQQVQSPTPPNGGERPHPYGKDQIPNVGGLLGDEASSNSHQHRSRSNAPNRPKHYGGKCYQDREHSLGRGAYKLRGKARVGAITRRPDLKDGPDHQFTGEVQ